MAVRRPRWPSAAGALMALGCLAVVLAPMATAHGYKLGSLSIGHVWASPPQAGATGMAVFGPILNTGKAPASLIGGDTPVADRVRFRIEKDGEESWPDSIALQPGRPVSLAPWREHIWLSGLREPPKAGDAFDLTLDFGDAGRLTVRVVVEGDGAD